MRWPAWLRTAPRLVAESLREVGDPLAAWLPIGPPAPAGEVAAALAHALLPREATDAPPDWLRADQHLSFRRVLAAARRFGGAILADPVGTGKTYVGLAAAGALSRGRPILAVVPASLGDQWREAALRTGVDLKVHSHERLSRGRPPPGGVGAVVIDESHRFRNPAARRYRTLAPWLVGRRGVMLTATPAVNRFEDVAHQLLLLVRDDALAGFGLPSLRSGLESIAIPALAAVVVTGEDRTALRPLRRVRTAVPADDPEQARLMCGIDRLRLSADPGIASLIRLSLLASLGSSPGALRAALGRYRSLLRHAAEARDAGKTFDRRSLRRTVSRAEDQLVMWALFPDLAAQGELELGDLELVSELIAGAESWTRRGDSRSALLGRLLGASDRRTIVFTTFRSTVGHLRAMLPAGTAWCTGSAAGIGARHMDRGSVLSWFREGKAPRFPDKGPCVLLATDVAAEGLDLTRIERVVHFDLPWTEVRLRQREGRALRLGARHDTVEVVRFGNRPELESRLAREARIARKSGLPILLGIDEGADAPWRVSAQLAESWRNAAARDGIAAVGSDVAAAIVGFRVHAGGDEVWCSVRARVGVRWTSDLSVITGLLERARRGAALSPDPADARRCLEALAPEIRAALRSTHRNEAGAGDAAAVRRLRGRLLGLARRAALRRDRNTLQLIVRGLGWLGRGMTAGEESFVARCLELRDRDVLAALQRFPRIEPASAPIAVSVAGVLLLQSTMVPTPCRPDAGSATLPPWRPSQPCSSTSTEHSSTRCG